MNTFLAIGLIVLVLGVISILISSLSVLVIYGKPIKNKLVVEAINKNLSNGISLNPYDNEILNIGNMNYISVNKFCCFSRYHISEIGTIWRFSKADKMIDEIYKSFENDLDAKKRRKLGL